MGEFTLGFRDGTTERFGGVAPFLNDHLSIGHGFLVTAAISKATGQFRDFRDEAPVGGAPVDDQFVTHTIRSRIGLPIKNRAAATSVARS